MKKLILVVLGAFFANAVFAQRWDMGSSFNYARPISGMARNIDQGFGITFEGARVMKTAPFTVGLEFAYNAYGRDVSRQQFTFDDGTVTETNVIVTNSFANRQIIESIPQRKSRVLLV